MPRINEPVPPTYYHPINFSPFQVLKVLKQTQRCASSLYSFAKNCSFQSAKQNLASWVKALFRPYYLPWICMKDLESFKQAMDENPFVCLKTLIHTLSKNPLKADEILRSLFREQLDHSDRYPAFKERQSSINEVLVNILLSPYLIRVNNRLFSLEGNIEENLVLESSNDVCFIRDQFQKWEAKIFASRSVKTFSEYIIVLWEKNKNNLQKYENKEYFNIAVEDINVFFKELLKDPEIPRSYKVLLEKTCQLLSNTRHRESLFMTVCKLIWEYNRNYEISVYKIWVEGKHGPFKSQSKFIDYCKAVLRCIGIRT